VVLLTLVTIGVAQLFDYGTFVVMIRTHGLAVELNPVVASGGASLGLVGLALAKAALVLRLVSVVVLLREGRWGEHRRLAGFIAAFAIVAGIVGGASNAMTI
jgi:hypothetical protein